MPRNTLRLQYSCSLWKMFVKESSASRVRRLATTKAEIPGNNYYYLKYNQLWSFLKVLGIICIHTLRSTAITIRINISDDTLRLLERVFIRTRSQNHAVSRWIYWKRPFAEIVAGIWWTKQFGLFRLQAIRRRARAVAHCGSDIAVQKPVQTGKTRF